MAGVTRCSARRLGSDDQRFTIRGIARDALGSGILEYPSWVISRVASFGKMYPPSPTPALITPTASPRCLVNHGAINIDAGTSDAAAMPIPSRVQNEYHWSCVCVVDSRAIAAAQVTHPPRMTTLGEYLSQSHPTGAPALR